MAKKNKSIKITERKVTSIICDFCKKSFDPLSTDIQELTCELDIGYDTTTSIKDVCKDCLLDFFVYACKQEWDTVAGINYQLVKTLTTSIHNQANKIADEKIQKKLKKINKLTKSL